MCYRKPARPHDIFVKYKLYNKLNQQIMSLRLNDIAPDFTQQLPRAQFNSTNGWGMDGPYCFHIRKTLRLCTTELGYMAKLAPDFAKRNCKIIGLSVDPVESHFKWEKDIEGDTRAAITYPMIGDPDLAICQIV